MGVDTCTPEQFSTRTELLAIEYAMDTFRLYVFGHDCFNISMFFAVESKKLNEKLENISVWNRKVYYFVHNSPPHGPVLSQMNPVHTLLSLFYKVSFNIILSPTLIVPFSPLSCWVILDPNILHGFLL